MSSEVTSSMDAHSQNKMAVVYMFGSVLLFSVLPIVFSVGGADKAPFLFSAVIQFFALISYFVYLVTFKPAINNQTLKIVLANFRHSAIWWATLGTFSYALFALALKHVDIVVATMLRHTNPIFMILITAYLFRKSDRYRTITPETLFLLSVGFIGVGFVIFSQDKYIDNVIFEVGAIFGIGAAILASLIQGLLPSHTLKWGAHMSEKVASDDTYQLFFTVVSLAVVRILGIGIAVILGLYFGENINNINIFPAMAFGLIGPGAAAILLRVANIKTENLAVNALSFTTPLFALFWLYTGSLVNVPHVDWLIIGVAAIISANLLLNFKVEIRSAYKALIIALWVCGTSVYLHTSFPLPDYIEIVGVIATLFILILAFRVDRLVRRTTEEESNEFFLFHQLSMLVKSGGINNDAPNQLREIGRHIKPSELRNSYGTLKKYFMDAHNKLAKDDRALLGELEARVDALTHSKQQGANFGELTALGFMGFIMVSALLLFKPVELTGWEGLFVETSSFLLATAIVFLFANIFDLQNDRTNAILAKEDGNDFYSVAFDDAGDRGSERWISITVCIAITAAYIWLFLGKWIF